MASYLFNLSPYSYFAFVLVFLSLCAVTITLRSLYKTQPTKDTSTNPLTNSFALHAAEKHPHPIWVTTGAGGVLWQNDACPMTISNLAKGALQNGPHRLNFASAGAPQWYDITTANLGGGNSAFFAAPANEKLQAVATKNEFMQTLSKIFAQLSTGLAVFDQNRDLILFNPYLLDLTHLNFETLSRKPSLATFLDLLRERGLVPEHKNYAQWRDDIAKMEIAAKNGTYCENWQIAGNITLRVTGRPHTNGAIAFMIEDISNEISARISVKANLERYTNILGAIKNPVILLKPTGDIAYFNPQYVALWAHEPKGGSGTLLPCLKHWQKSSSPNQSWGDLRDFVSSFENRAEWGFCTKLNTGTNVELRCIPLGARETLIEFISI